MSMERRNTGYEKAGIVAAIAAAGAVIAAAFAWLGLVWLAFWPITIPLTIIFALVLLLAAIALAKVLIPIVVVVLIVAVVSKVVKAQRQRGVVGNTTQSQTVAPPGYYPDINGQQRYWDGQQWTEDTR